MMEQGALRQRGWCVRVPVAVGTGWARPGSDGSEQQGICVVQGLGHICPLDSEGSARAGGEGGAAAGLRGNCCHGLRAPRNTWVGSELGPWRMCLK